MGDVIAAAQDQNLNIFTALKYAQVVHACLGQTRVRGPVTDRTPGGFWKVLAGPAFRVRDDDDRSVL